MKTAIYPGSFDPVTYGHLEIISRASKLFDKVIVLVSVNPLKPCSFTIDERKQFLRESVVAEGIGNVEVDSNEGLLIDYFNEHNADVIVKVFVLFLTSNMNSRWHRLTESCATKPKRYS